MAKTPQTVKFSCFSDQMLIAVVRVNEVVDFFIRNHVAFLGVEHPITIFTCSGCRYVAIVNTTVFDAQIDVVVM